MTYHPRVSSPAKNVSSLCEEWPRCFPPHLCILPTPAALYTPPVLFLFLLPESELISSTLSIRKRRMRTFRDRSDDCYYHRQLHTGRSLIGNPFFSFFFLSFFFLLFPLCSLPLTTQLDFIFKSKASWLILKIHYFNFHLKRFVLNNNNFIAFCYHLTFKLVT